LTSFRSRLSTDYFNKLSLISHSPFIAIAMSSMSTWTIYLNTRRQTQASNEDFQNSLNTVGTLGTYQAFAATWRQQVQPQFTAGSVRVFRDDITPMWEHSANQGGGTMLTNVSVADKHSFEAFLAVMEGLMNDTLVHAEMITGVVVAFRPWGYTMSLWLREGLHVPSRAELVNCVQLLTQDDTLKFAFKLHGEHQASIEKRRQNDRFHERERPNYAERTKLKYEKHEKPRLEKGDHQKSHRTIVQPEDLLLEGSDLVSTKVRGRRVAPPKYTLAELESRWTKEFDLDQQAKAGASAWTLREALWGIGMFTISAFFVSQLSTAAF